jgi:hypothetical protein
MTEGNPGSTGWAAFEARMRDRRFARCIEHANAGLESGTLEEVRDALDEARILCPGAPEIAELEHRIAALPSPSSVLLASQQSVQEPPAGWLRVMGAMAILVVLFGLFGFGLAQLYLNPPAALLTDADTTTAAPDALAPAGAAPDTARPSTSSIDPAPLTPAPPPPVPAPSEPAPKPSASETITAPAGPIGTTSRPAPIDAAPRTRPDEPSTLRDVRPSGTAARVRETPPAAREELPASKPPASSPAASPRVTPPPVPAPTIAQRLPDPPARPQPEPTRPAPTTPPPAYEPPPAVSAVARSAPVTDPVLPLEAPVLSPSATAPRAVPASVSREDESAQIRTLLSRYETAYNRLDAATATSLYPAVDRAALDRAFKGLISQRVSLGLCDITVIGDVGGASCAGKARWEPRVGGGLQTADRYWTFNLRKSTEGWRIEQIRVR